MGHGGRETGVPERGDSPSAVFLVSYKPSQQFFWVSRNVEASVGYLFTGSFHLSFPSFPKKRLILRLVGNRVLVGHPMLALSSMALIAQTAFVLLTTVMVFTVLNLKWGSDTISLFINVSEQEVFLERKSLKKSEGWWWAVYMCGSNKKKIMSWF